MKFMEMLILIAMAGGVAYFTNFQGFKDWLDALLAARGGDPGPGGDGPGPGGTPSCEDREECQFGMPGYGEDECYPCGWPVVVP